MPKVIKQKTHMRNTHILHTSMEVGVENSVLQLKLTKL